MLLVFTVVTVLALPLLYVGANTAKENSDEILRQKTLIIALHLAVDDARQPVLFDNVVPPQTEISAREVSELIGEETNVTVKVDGITKYQLIRLNGGDLHSYSITTGRIEVTLAESDRSTEFTIAYILLSTFVVGAIGAILSWFLTRSLSKKFVATLADLTAFAQRIGSGDTRTRPNKYYIEELDEVAEVLDASARRIEELLITERRITSEVSHQLRTPLTALALLVDEIGEIANDPEAVKLQAIRAGAQIDRLNQSMSELMVARRGLETRGPGEPLVTVLAPVISDLSPTLKLQGRKIETDIPEGLMADVPSGAIRHIASILLDNALRHGEGTVGMTVKHSGDWLVLTVTDQGKGLDSDTGDMLKQIDLELNRAAAVNKPETIGLTLATALASAQGGRLEWRPTEPATLRVYLRSMSKDETTISQEPENGS